MNKTTIFILALITFLQAEALGRNSKTVEQLLRNVNKKSIEKKATVIRAGKVEEKKIKRSQPKNIMPKSEDFRINTTGEDAVSEQFLNEQIRIMSGLVKKHKSASTRGELWLRLAELYIQKASYLDKAIQTKFDNELAKWEARNRTGKRPVLNTSSVNEYSIRSIKLCEAFLTQFPKDSKVDRVLYFLGLNYMELGKSKQAIKHFNQLKAKYKNSEYIGLASFVLATHYFDTRQWTQAKQNYLAVIKNKYIAKPIKQNLVPNALYKYAWSDLQLDNPDRALVNLEKIYRLSKSKNSLEGYKRLKKPVLFDIVQIYSRTKKSASSAERYLTNTLGLSEKNISKYLKAIAYQYSDNGNLSSARLLFKRLIQIKPNSKEALDYQEEIVKMYRHADNKIFLAELNIYITRFAKGSDWYKANVQNQELINESAKTREILLRNYILNNHQLYQKSRTKASKNRILGAYPIYLREFSNSKEASTMHFYYAELMYDLKNYDKAMKHYMIVADGDTKSKHYDTALLNALLAADETIKKVKTSKRTNSIEKIPYTQAESNFVKLAKKYVATIKNDKNSASIHMKLARLYYLKNNFDEALVNFWDIIKKFPKSKQATYSANLILDVYNLKKDYQGLAEAGKKLLKYETLIASAEGGKSEIKNIKNIVNNARLKNVQDIEKKGDHLLAAREYIKFAKQSNDLDLKNKVTFNAAINFEKANAALKAIDQYEAYLKINRDTSDETVKKANRLLANLYEQTGNLQKAAVEFEKYAKSYPSDQYADESILNSARIFRGFKQYQKALNNFRTYRNKVTSKAKKDKILFEIAETKEEMRNRSQAYTDYSNYVTSNPSDGHMLMSSLLKLFRMAQKFRKNDIVKWRDKIIGTQKALSNIGMPEAAEARFHKAKQLYSTFAKSKISHNPAKQAATIVSKQKLLDKLAAELSAIIKYDDGHHVVRSVAMIAEANEDFIKAIEAVPVPKVLKTKQQIAEYKQGIEQQLLSPRRKIVMENYKLAIDKAFELHAYNESVTRSFKRLAKLEPNQYSFMSEKVMPVEKLDTYGLNKKKNREKYKGLLASLKARDLKLAIKEAAKILAKNPKDAVVYNTLAVIALNKGNNYLAALYLGKIHKSRGIPSTTKKNNMAMVLLKKGGANRSFSEFYGSALKNENVVASANAGTILLKYQNFKDALPYLAKAARTYSKDVAVLNNYAIALKYSGRTRKSANVYKKALKLASSKKAGWIKLNYARLMQNTDKNKAIAKKTLNEITFNESDTKLISEAKVLLRQMN